MKKALVAVVGLLVSLFAFAACGTSSTEVESTPTEVASTPTAEETVADTPAPKTASASDEEAMVERIRVEDSMFYTVSSRQIIETANSVCEALRSGTTIEEAMSIAVDSLGEDHAVAFMAGAIMYLCPEQKVQLQKYE